MFSVSVDTLIGDVESKTTNKIKKKIDDLGWFVFGFAVYFIVVITSVYELLSMKIQDDNIMFVITGFMIIIAFIILAAGLKSYLKNNEDVILNMKDTEEGKEERRKYIIKKYATSIFYWFILSPILKIGRLAEGTDVFIIEVIQWSILGLVLDLILSINEYTKLERKVKELNKE